MQATFWSSNLCSTHAFFPYNSFLSQGYKARFVIVTVLGGVSMNMPLPHVKEAIGELLESEKM